MRELKIRPGVLLAAAVAAAALLGALVVVLVGWQRGGGGRRRSPSAEPLPEIEADVVVAPREVLFGDTVQARFEIVLDKERVDPESVRVAADFSPWEIVGRSATRRQDDGDVAVSPNDLRAQVRHGHVRPVGTVGPLRLSARPNRVRRSSRSANRGELDRASTAADSRVLALRGRAPGTPIRSRRRGVPTSCRFPPCRTVSRRASCSPCCSAARRSRRSRGSRSPTSPGHAALPAPPPEPPPPPPVPVLSPLEQALVLLEHSIRTNGAAAQRRALEQVAEQLELSDWGDPKLAREARVLAWSEDVPPVERDDEPRRPCEERAAGGRGAGRERRRPCRLRSEACAPGSGRAASTCTTRAPSSAPPGGLASSSSSSAELPWRSSSRRSRRHAISTPRRPGSSRTTRRESSSSTSRSRSRTRTTTRFERRSRRLIADNASIGLVVFSDVAYELLPPGTPASELRPMLRLLVPPTARPSREPVVDHVPRGNARCRPRSSSRGTCFGATGSRTGRSSSSATSRRLRTTSRRCPGSSRRSAGARSSCARSRSRRRATLASSSAACCRREPSRSLPGRRRRRSRVEAAIPVPRSLLLLGALLFVALAAYERFASRLALTGGRESVIVSRREILTRAGLGAAALLCLVAVGRARAPRRGRRALARSHARRATCATARPRRRRGSGRRSPCFRSIRRESLLGIDDDIDLREAIRALRLARLDDPVVSDPELAVRRNEAQARLEALVATAPDDCDALPCREPAGSPRACPLRLRDAGAGGAPLRHRLQSDAGDRPRSDERRAEVQPRARVPARSRHRAQRGRRGNEPEPWGSGLERRRGRPARKRVLMAVSLLTPSGLLLALGVVLPLVVLLFVRRRARTVRRGVALVEPPSRAFVATVVAFARDRRCSSASPQRSPWSSRRGRSASEPTRRPSSSSTCRGRCSHGKTPARHAASTRAKTFAKTLRASLPEIRFGVASITDRTLPHLFPSADREVFDATVDRSLGIEQPPPRSSLAQLSTNLEALATIRSQRYFAPKSPKRLVVVLTDGETQPVSGARLASLFGRPPVTHVVFVHFWSRDERVFTEGAPEPQYRPEPVLASRPRRARQGRVRQRVLGATRSEL